MVFAGPSRAGANSWARVNASLQVRGHPHKYISPNGSGAANATRGTTMILFVVPGGSLKVPRWPFDASHGESAVALKKVVNNIGGIMLAMRGEFAAATCWNRWWAVLATLGS